MKVFLGNGLDEWVPVAFLGNNAFIVASTEQGCRTPSKWACTLSDFMETCLLLNFFILKTLVIKELINPPYTHTIAVISTYSKDLNTYL